jgi:hypothetical protein
MWLEAMAEKETRQKSWSEPQYLGALGSSEFAHRCLLLCSTDLRRVHSARSEAPFRKRQGCDLTIIVNQRGTGFTLCFNLRVAIVLSMTGCKSRPVAARTFLFDLPSGTASRDGHTAKRRRQAFGCLQTRCPAGSSRPPHFRGHGAAPSGSASTTGSGSPA